jgi:hypothetical protein
VYGTKLASRDKLQLEACGQMRLFDRWIVDDDYTWELPQAA